MKKRSFIGLSCGILVLFIIVGIASLPDEVLTESSAVKELHTLPQEEQMVPASDKSFNFVASSDVQKNIDSTNAELDSLKKEITELKNELVQLKINSQKSDQTLPSAQDNDINPKQKLPEEPQEDSEAKTITIRISDGVGTDMR
jgi:hypothetical protein